MAAISLTPELGFALIERFKSEYAETAAANFALDIVNTALSAEVQKLRDFSEALAERNRTLMEDLSVARQERDALRPDARKVPRGKNAD